jgi:hypothetical protein
MPSTTLTISDEDRATLTTWTRSSTVPAGHGERAAIVLTCAEGAGTSDAARRLGVSRPTVIKWRDRFAEAYAREMAEFIDVIDGAPVRVGTAAGTQAVALVLAGTVSLLENRTAAVSEALTMTIPPWQVDSGDRE